jgi:hypothetical protein
MKPDQAPPDLDELLRQAFEAAPADDAFVAQVMHTLPPRRPRRAWPLPAAAAAGALLAWLALAASPLVAQAAHEWRAADPGAALGVLMALMVGLGLLGCAWALAEEP